MPYQCPSNALPMPANILSRGLWLNVISVLFLVTFVYFDQRETCQALCNLCSYDLGYNPSPAPSSATSETPAPLHKVSKTNQEMFSSSLQCLVDLANSVKQHGDDGAEEDLLGKADNGTQAPAQTNISVLSDLVREANEKIRFSIHFDARKNQQMQANKFLNVKEDLHKVKQDIQGLKNDLKSAEKPLMVFQILLQGGQKRSVSNDLAFFIVMNF